MLGNKEAYDVNPVLPSELAQLSYPPQTDSGRGESLTLTSVQIEAFDISAQNFVTGTDRGLNWIDTVRAAMVDSGEPSSWAAAAASELQPASLISERLLCDVMSSPG